MDFLVISDRLERLFQQLYHHFINPKFWRQHAKQLGLSCAILAVLIGGGLTYHWQAKRQTQVTLKLFRECALLYKRALVANKPELWMELEAAAKGAYGQAKSSYLAPYLLIYQVQALKQQGKTTELAELIKLAVKKVSPRSPLYPNFKLIEALTLVDTQDPLKITQATKLLEKLTASRSNFAPDLTGFYLGELYSYQGRVDLAKRAYENVVQKFQLATESADLQIQQASPWVKLAQERLQNL